MNREFMVDYGVGVRMGITYFKLTLFYEYGDPKCPQFMHIAYFGMN